MSKLRVLLVLVLLSGVMAGSVRAFDVTVDSRLNAIDLGSANVNVAAAAVRFETYRSIPYAISIPSDNPPVYYDSNGNQFEGAFLGGIVGATDQDRPWWHKSVTRSASLQIPPGFQNLLLFSFMTDYGNLGDNSGQFNLDVEPTAWGDLPPLPVSGLFGMSTTTDPLTGKIYVFGGGTAPLSWFNTTWVLDPRGPNGWSEVPAGGTGPAPRYYHSAVHDPNPGGNPRMIIFGGMTAPTNKYNDTWALDLITLQWTQLSTTGSRPPVCNYHRAVLDPDGGAHPRMICRGGELGQGTYALDLTTLDWSLLQSGGGPGVRHGGGMAYYHPQGGNPQIFWFGGGTSSTYYNDLWSLDLVTLAWTLMPVGPYGPPPRREQCRMVIDPVKKELILYGGFNGGTTTFFNDVWVYELITSCWAGQVLDPAQGWPTGVSSHDMAYDQAHGVLVITGGTGVGGCRSEVKAFTPGRPLPLSGVQEPADDSAKSGALRCSAVPLPSSGRTRIDLEVPNEAPVEVVIVDASGRVVREFPAERVPAGTHSLTWDGRAADGARVPDGVYFYRIRSGELRGSGRLVLVQ